MLYLLLFHYNNGCTNAPRCYVIRTLPVVLRIRFNIISRFATFRCFIRARRASVTVTRNSHFMSLKFMAMRSWIYARFPCSLLCSLFRRISGNFKFKFLDARWSWVTASHPGHFVTKSSPLTVSNNNEIAPTKIWTRQQRERPRPCRTSKPGP